MSRRWTDEELDILKDLVAKNWSSSRIGRKLDRSTSAVVQKIHDLKLSGKRSGRFKLGYFRLPGSELKPKKID